MKVLSEEEFTNVYTFTLPNIKREEFIKIYSYYRYYAQNYLAKILNLKELNKYLKKESSGLRINILNKEISNLDFEYIFLATEFNLSKLSLEELELFNTYLTNDKKESLNDFIFKTISKVIESNLVIGLIAIESENLTNYLNQKSDEYTKIIHIPTQIQNFYSHTNTSNLSKYPVYLPLGSIIVPKEGAKKLMIMGYCGVNLEKKDKIFDYICCYYPEGIISNEHFLLNHDDIKIILAIGYTDQEATNFLANLKKEQQ